jgi:tripartite ATP-independent transporter DctM subunit
MDAYLLGLIAVIFLFLLLALGIHIGLALAIVGLAGGALLTNFEQSITLSGTTIYHKVASPALITLPLFILMGYLASGGGISKNLFDSLSLWFGRLRGGLGIATTLGCTAFGTVCGSSLVTTAVFAKICAPEMRRYGYDKRIAYGICASAGSIGMLIPPSILAIVYATLTGVSLGKVLMAGVAPGLMWAGFFSLALILIGNLRPSMVPLSPATSDTWRRRIKSLTLWWPIAVVAGVTFGGIYGGVFTPSEAAAIAAFVLIVMYLFVRIIFKRGNSRREGSKELYSMLCDTATTSAMVFLVMGCASIFSNFIALSGLTAKISSLITAWGLSKLGIVLLFSFIYLILGCFLDSISMLCITVPVFNPIVEASGIDLIWYATIVIVSIEIGLITPPFGLNLFAAKAVAENDVSLEDVIAGIVPFLVAEVLSLILLFAFPKLSTFLPSFVGY